MRKHCLSVRNTVPTVQGYLNIILCWGGIYPEEPTMRNLLKILALLACYDHLSYFLGEDKCLVPDSVFVVT